MAATISDERFLDQLVAALAEVGLEAIIVGNTASILHGAPVLTQDVDLLVRDTARNRAKLKRLATALGGTGPHPISELTSTVRILGAAVPIDVLFNQLSGGLRFESVRSRSAGISTGSQVATVASLEDVIRSKEAANRPKDLAALPMLRDTLRVKQALQHETDRPPRG